MEQSASPEIVAETEVMGYLVKNLSYHEISKKMGVTKAAVDYHIHILHEKFDVSNTRDLLGKAHDSKFVNVGDWGVKRGKYRFWGYFGGNASKEDILIT